MIMKILTFKCTVHGCDKPIDDARWGYQCRTHERHSCCNFCGSDVWQHECYLSGDAQNEVDTARNLLDSIRNLFVEIDR